MGPGVWLRRTAEPDSAPQRCIVVRKGLPLSTDIHSGRQVISSLNVWWLLPPNSKHMIAAYQDPLHGQLREMALPKARVPAAPSLAALDFILSSLPPPPAIPWR